MTLAMYLVAPRSKHCYIALLEEDDISWTDLLELARISNYGLITSNSKIWLAKNLVEN